jgi:hypothetical protein
MSKVEIINGHQDEDLDALVGEVQEKQAQERIDLQKDLLQVQLELFKKVLTEKPIDVSR